jgi:hypothetical protein
MSTVSRGDDWDAEKSEEQRQAQESDLDRHIAKLTAHWKKNHDGKVKEIEVELLHEYPKATADEKLLLHLTAHDVALAGILGETEAQVAQRLLALMDSVQSAVALAKILKQVVACREVVTRRVLELTQTANVLRGQRRMRETAPLRRVA